MSPSPSTSAGAIELIQKSSVSGVTNQGPSVGVTSSNTGWAAAGRASAASSASNIRFLFIATVLRARPGRVTPAECRPAHWLPVPQPGQVHRRRKSMRCVQRPATNTPGKDTPDSRSPKPRPRSRCRKDGQRYTAIAPSRRHPIQRSIPLGYDAEARARAQVRNAEGRPGAGRPPQFDGRPAGDEAGGEEGPGSEEGARQP